MRAPSRSGDRRRSRIYTGGSRGQRGDGGRARRGERPTLESPGAVAGTGGLHREILARERGREGRGGLHASFWAGAGQRGRRHLSGSGDSPARAVSTRLRRGLGPRRLREGHLSAPPPPPQPPERRAGLGWEPPPAPRQAPSPALGRRPAAGARGLRQLRALSWRSGRPWPEPGSSCRPICLCRICRSPGEGTEGWDKAASATGSGAVTYGEIGVGAPEWDDQGSPRHPPWLAVGAPGSAERARDVGESPARGCPFLAPSCRPCCAEGNVAPYTQRCAQG